DRLRSLGYEFAQPREVFAPLTRGERANLQCLERKAGPLPLSLRVFYETVGSVCLMGSHPGLSSYWKASDPAEMLRSTTAIYTHHMGPVPTPEAPPIQAPPGSPL